MKSKYSSYYIKDIPTGCKYCVKGEKLVLFISGVCKRNCYYCSLSKKRKNKDHIYANERLCKNIREIITEAIESNATSAGITGGDPLLFLNRTIRYAKALKKNFGKNFHIHIYLPTMYITENKLKKLSRYIDEVRFHPEFLIKKQSENDIQKDIKKIKISNKYWKKEKIGIELPMIPEKKQDIFDFINKISKNISFVNLNELELSDHNFDFMTKNYKFNDTGYVIKNSRQAGLWLLKKLKEKDIKINVHFCTAELKNNFQFKNRLRLHKIFPFGHRTSDGNVIYLSIEKRSISDKLKKIMDKSNSYFDKDKSRYIISEKLAKKIIGSTKIERTEEFPTFDRFEIEKDSI